MPKRFCRKGKLNVGKWWKESPLVPSRTKVEKRANVQGMTLDTLKDMAQLPMWEKNFVRMAVDGQWSQQHAAARISRALGGVLATEFEEWVDDLKARAPKRDFDTIPVPYLLGALFAYYQNENGYGYACDELQRVEWKPGQTFWEFEAEWKRKRAVVPDFPEEAIVTTFVKHLPRAAQDQPRATQVLHKSDLRKMFRILRGYFPADYVLTSSGEVTQKTQRKQRPLLAPMEKVDPIEEELQKVKQTVAAQDRQMGRVSVDIDALMQEARVLRHLLEEARYQVPRQHNASSPPSHHPPAPQRSNPRDLAPQQRQRASQDPRNQRNEALRCSHCGYKGHTWEYCRRRLREEEGQRPQPPRNNRPPPHQPTNNNPRPATSFPAQPGNA